MSFYKLFMDGGNDSEEMNLSYELLFEIVRREKNRDDLQKLPKNFYPKLSEYLKEKQKALSAENSDLFTAEEIEKTRVQLSNTKKLISDLFERREKKIISLALNKIRTQSAIIDTSAVLKEETHFYEKLMHVLSEFRGEVLVNLHNKTLLNYIPKPAKQYEVKKEEAKGVKDEIVSQRTEDMQPSKVADHPYKSEISDKPKDDTKTVRFVAKIPKFMGKSMEVYGPYNEDDIASFPVQIANILIKKGKAEEIQTG